MQVFAGNVPMDKGKRPVLTQPDYAWRKIVYFYLGLLRLAPVVGLLFLYYALVLEH